jgi:hypothetical protein
MEWLNEHVTTIISIFFGTGGIVYAVVSRILDKKKYEQEVRGATAEADIKGDEFWKQRYDVLQKEDNTLVDVMLSFDQTQARFVRLSVVPVAKVAKPASEVVGA